MHLKKSFTIIISFKIFIISEFLYLKIEFWNFVIFKIWKFLEFGNFIGFWNFGIFRTSEFLENFVFLEF